MQSVNNGLLNTRSEEVGYEFEFSTLQSSAVIFKLVFLIVIFFESIWYVVQSYYLNQFLEEATRSGEKPRLNEIERRQVFGIKYATFNAIWFFVLFFTFVIVAMTAES